MSDPYEEPISPDLIGNTENASLDKSVDAIFGYRYAKGPAAAGNP